MLCILTIFVYILIGCGTEIQAYWPNQSRCKAPSILRSKFYDDVMAAAPFYVVAMTATPKTEEIDNICYTYFHENDSFFHIESIVFKNGTSSQVFLHKKDLPGQLGVVLGRGEDCIYHDITMPAVCNDSVIPIYRCFKHGGCSVLDLGPVARVDARVLLAADPNLSEECKQELRDGQPDPVLTVGDQGLVLLPQNLSYECITSLTTNSINHDKALGSKVLEWPPFLNGVTAHSLDVINAVQL